MISGQSPNPKNHGSDKKSDEAIPHRFSISYDIFYELPPINYEPVLSGLLYQHTPYW